MATKAASTGGRAPAAKATAAGTDWMIQTILRCLLRRWKQVLGFGVVAAVVAGSVVWFFLPPPVPTAAAKLYLPKNPVTTLGGEHPDPPIDRQTQIELVRSRLVLAAAIRPTEISGLTALQQEDPLDWLVKNLRVEFSGPEILRISLSYQDPEQARLIVDAVKNSFMQHVINRSSNARQERKERLMIMATDQEEALRRKRLAILNMAKGSGGFDTERQLFQQQLLRDQMQAVRMQLSRIEGELQSGRLREKVLSIDPDSTIPESLLKRYTDSDSRVVDATQKLKLAEEQHREFISKLADPNSPLAADELQKLEEKRKSLTALRDSVRKDIVSQALTQTKAEQAGRLTAQKQENSILDAQVKQLRGELEEYGKSLSNERLRVEEMEPIRFDIKQTEELLTKIRAALATLTLENYAQARVLELEEAVIIPVDAAKRRMLLAVGAAIVALLLVGVLAVLLEMRHRRIESPTEVQGSLGLRLVGTVPKFIQAKFRPDGSLDPYHEQRSEAIACARTMLLHSRDFSAVRMVMVASPVAGEGKTTLSVQLAVSIAQGGLRTLVLDGDLRNPRMGHHFKNDRGPGFCEVLRGEASIFDIIQPTSVPGLMYIPAGQWTPETPEFLIANRLEQVFRTLRDQFDFVLLDSSPVLPVSDALIMGRHTDGVILSLLQGVSRTPQVNEAVERFNMLGVEVLGVVLNGTPGQGYGYGGYSYSSKTSLTRW
jgi:capsular exopolysaccharide synthesis family protein